MNNNENVNDINKRLNIFCFIFYLYEKLGTMAYITGVVKKVNNLYVFVFIGFGTI